MEVELDTANYSIQNDIGAILRQVSYPEPAERSRRTLEELAFERGERSAVGRRVTQARNLGYWEEWGGPPTSPSDGF